MHLSRHLNISHAYADTYTFDIFHTRLSHSVLYNPDRTLFCLMK